MATFTDTWNSSFDGAPDGSTVDANTLDSVIASRTKAVRERIAVEHNLSLTNSADQGTHKAGSALAYYQAAAPTERPSGDTLDADDAGRFWINSDDGTVDYWDGSAFQSITTPASATTQGIVETEDSATVKCAVIDIGDWNMNVSGTGSNTVNVVHGLTFGNIRQVYATVRNDDGTLISNAVTGSTSNSGSVGGISWDSTNVKIVHAGTPYNSADYDSTTYNRGWITIWYEV